MPPPSRATMIIITVIGRRMAKSGEIHNAGAWDRAKDWPNLIHKSHCIRFASHPVRPF